MIHNQLKTLDFQNMQAAADNDEEDIERYGNFSNFTQFFFNYLNIQSFF